MAISRPLTRWPKAALAVAALAAGCASEPATTPAVPAVQTAAEEPAAANVPTTARPDPVAACADIAKGMLDTARAEAAAESEGLESIDAVIAAREKVGEALKARRVNKEARDDIRDRWLDEQEELDSDTRFGYVDLPEYEALQNALPGIDRHIETAEAALNDITRHRNWYQGKTRGEAWQPPRWSEIQLGLRDALWCFAGELPNHCGGQTGLDARAGRLTEPLASAADIGPLIDDASGYYRCYTDAAARR